MKAQLLCRVRRGTTLSFTLEGDEAVLGREPGLAMTVPLEGVSRRHARLTWDGRFHWLEDLKSTNGTFLNGRPVRRERLRHLDVISLGKKADLVFVLRSEEFRPVRAEGIVRAVLVPLEGEGDTHDVPAGEVTLGRSTACNIVAESAAVSKVHARLERTLTQLLLQDLGSSNGTFVNGARVTRTLLRDGDVLALGGLVKYRVEVGLGEVTSTSGLRSRAELDVGSTSSRPRPQFAADWKTRFEWDSGEMQAFEALKALGPSRTTAPVDVSRPSGDAGEHGPGGTIMHHPHAGASAAAGAGRPATPPKPVAPAPKPAAPAPKPTVPGPPPKPGPAASAVPQAKPVAASPLPRPPAVAAEARPPAARPAKPVTASAEKPPAAAQAPVAAAQEITEVRLRGASFDVAVSDTGAHELGRARESALRIDHPTVSRRHARVILADDRAFAYVQDLGGANGTRLNGQLIEKLAPLRDGDRLRIGEVELTVSLKRG